MGFERGHPDRGNPMTDSTAPDAPRSDARARRNVAVLVLAQAFQGLLQMTP